MELRDYIKKLEENDGLIKFEKEVLPKYEIPGVIRYYAEKKEKAIIFNNVKNYNINVVANLYGSLKNMALLFNVREEELYNAYLERGNTRIKPKIVDSSPVYDIIEKDVNITKKMPILTHWEDDAGPYMTSCLTVTKDPETGMRGFGLHRIQVKDKNKLGLYFASSPNAHFLKKAEEMNKPLEIAVVSGVSPAMFFAGIFMLGPLATKVDKFEVAGGFNGKPIELVKCKTIDVEIPANAEFVLEGKILPGVRETEGPFGESTGYYLTYENPVAEINLIAHRKNPIYHALMPYSREVEILTDIMMGPSLINMVRMQFSESEILNIKIFALGEYCVVKIKKKNDEEVKKILEYMLDMPFTKIVIAVDDDVDNTDLNDIAWIISTRVYFNRDIIIKENLPGLMIDPSVGDIEVLPEYSMQYGKTTKIGIDATKPLNQLTKFKRVDIPIKIKKKIFKLIN